MNAHTNFILSEEIEKATTRYNHKGEPAIPSIDSTLANRGELYGKFKTHAIVTQHIKDVMHQSPNWFTKLSESQRESLEMIAHKIGRILNGDPNYHDSWHDIVGYAKLVADELVGKEV